MGIFGKPDEKHVEPAAAQAPRPPAAPPTPAPHAPVAPRTGTTNCVVGVNTTIKGEILGDEDVLVEGNVEGQIRITRDLQVGPGGKVKANISARSVSVSGEVTGDCEASNRVEIQATGRLTGNIRAPKIIIAEGAMFRGNSDMSGRKEDRKDKVAIS